MLCAMQRNMQNIHTMFNLQIYHIWTTWDMKGVKLHPSVNDNKGFEPLKIDKATRSPVVGNYDLDVEESTTIGNSTGG